MRQGNNGRRPRGGRPNRRPGPLKAQTFDSNGPDVRIRGNAHQVYEKYLTLARDAGVGGDRVLAESYYQYAEHYYRIIHESTDPDSPGSHRPHFRDPRYDDRDWQGREWDAPGEEDGYPAQDGQVGPQGQGQGGQQGGGQQGGGQQGGGQQGGGQQGGPYQGGQRHQRSERFDNQRRDGQREGGQRGEGQRYEGQRYEGQRHEGQRHEGQRHEGQRHEGQRPEGQRPEGQRPEGQRPEGQRSEAPRGEGQAAEAQVERRQPRQPAPAAVERTDEDDRSGLERALGGRVAPVVAPVVADAEPVVEAAEAVAAPGERTPRAARTRFRRRQTQDEAGEPAGPARRPFPPRGEAGGDEPGTSGGEDGN